MVRSHGYFDVENNLTEILQSIFVLTKILCILTNIPNIDTDSRIDSLTQEYQLYFKPQENSVRPYLLMTSRS